MTAIFPSDDRIKDIVYRRVRELCNGDSVSPPRDANVTNIYERIVLEICSECFVEIPTAALSMMHHHRTVSINDHRTLLGSTTANLSYPLTFYNPPDRLACIQQHVLKRVNKLLRNSTVSGQQHNNNGHHHQLAQQSSQNTFVGGNRLISSKRKRDLVDEILVQEMLEDDAAWTNFDVERNEVLQVVANDLVRLMVDEALDDCQRAFDLKTTGQTQTPKPRAS